MRRGLTGAILPILALLGACAGPQIGAGWDGRRGYDGRGDYGYDVDASRAEASGYRARAARSYPVPGTPDDPWGPYVREAAVRYAVPERWIREVMRQESGGRLLAADGSLTTSPVGAMGLMQVMPATYDGLRRRYGLGGDAYEPHDNIMAGAGYIRGMFDRYGSPGFLAAYNAGPDRVDAYLAGAAPLPDETVSYVASIAPRLGGEVAMTGPLAAYASGGAADSDRAYGGGAAVVPAAAYAPADATDPANRAYDGGGLVTPEAPTGDRTGQGAAYAPDASMDRPVAAVVPVAAPRAVPGAWAVQVGAFPDPVVSLAAVSAARSRAGTLLAGAPTAITPVQRGRATFYRARLVGLSTTAAGAACDVLARGGVPCFTVPPGS